MGRQKHAVGDDTLEPLAKLLGILSSSWTLLLLHRLHLEGPKRFAALKPTAWGDLHQDAD